MEKVLTARCLARLKTELAGFQLLLWKNPTSARDDFAQEYAFL